MSSLLKEAIVDAKALKEAALKNAEAAIIEKYSAEVKETLDKLLEQDLADLGTPAPAPAGAADAAGTLGGDLGVPDLGADLAPADDMGLDLDAGENAEEILDDEQAPLAAADNLPGEAKDGQSTEIELDLGVLQEAIAELQNSMNESQQLDVDEDDIIEIMTEADQDNDGAPAPPKWSKKGPKNPDEPPAWADEDDNNPEVGDSLEEVEVVDEETLEEDAIDDVYASPTASLASAAQQDSDTKQMAALKMEEEIDFDDLLGTIAEKLTVDMKAELSGWAGRSSHDMMREMEKEFARRRSTDLQDNLETLKKAQEEVVFENKQLKTQLTQYKQATTELKESLQNVNLSNARLLYTNRVLRNTSLNERQKERIVEAISNAGSVTEARTIFDTLQSTVESTPKRGPKSLSEAITRRSSVIRASKHESTASDPIQDRLKRLAGIK